MRESTSVQTIPSEVPVLIVGCGPIGLTTSLLLTRHGVRTLLVERHPGTSIHPRARGINVRSMEIFRGLGLEAAVRKAGEPLAGSRYMLWVETLAGTEVRRVPTEEMHDGGAGRVAQLSPTDWASCAQDELEPILLAEARRLGVDVRFGVACERVQQDGEGVTATLLDRASGRLETVRSPYLVAADGARSGVRAGLGIGVTGAGTIARNVSIYFRADLRRQVQDRQFILCFVEHPAVRGILLSVNQSDRWILMVPEDPALGTSAAELSPERCIELIRLATGLPALPVEILSALPWEARAQVAERFRQGRVFLAGDAAHVMPPSGAFGMNTGLQDAHNLAWKLAAALAGTAGPSLLASYDQERRPVAVLTVENAVQTGAERFTHARAGRSPSGVAGAGQVAAPPAPAIDGLTVMLGYWYASLAVVGGPAAPPSLASLGRSDLVLDGRPGTRVPHLWLHHQGSRCSAVDLTEGQLSLLSGGPGTGWLDALQVAASARRLGVTGYQLGADIVPEAGEQAYRAALGIDEGGAVLVRPDGFVGWRSEPGQGPSPDLLGGVLDRLLSRV